MTLPTFGQSESELMFTILGLALLLFGWLIFRFGSRLISIGLGAAFGFFIGEVLNIILKIDRNTGLYVTIGCSAIGGLAAIFMLRAATNFLFAGLGFLFGALIGRIAAEMYADMNNVALALDTHAASIILPVAGVTALLAVWLQRLIMILITSFMGATFLVAGIDYLSQQPLAFPAVLTAGIIWQGFIMGRIFKTAKRRPPRQRNDSED